MRSTIVLALGLFATQTVGVHLAANANTDANDELDFMSDSKTARMCSGEYARDLMKHKVEDGHWNHMNYDKFETFVTGLLDVTLTQWYIDMILEEM